MSNSVTVKICGEEYKLITDDSIEYTQSVGSRVNAEMQKLLSTKRVGRMDAAILAALNIADELFKVRETDEQLRAQIKSALDEAAAAKAEVNALKRESVNLQKRLEKAEKAQKAAEKGLQKAQKAAGKPAKQEEPDAGETPAPLDEAAMAELVEKSKRPRKTRKTKAEAVSVETVEEVTAEPAPEAVTETPTEAADAPEVVETPQAVETPEAVTEEAATPDAVEES
ncbi:MAG: cell division protein ZapA [Oscillibacter sp.]|nr:cell division protein ZapA [Oscillibacter sp.]